MSLLLLAIHRIFQKLPHPTGVSECAQHLAREAGGEVELADIELLASECQPPTKSHSQAVSFPGHIIVWSEEDTTLIPTNSY